MYMQYRREKSKSNFCLLKHLCARERDRQPGNEAIGIVVVCSTPVANTTLNIQYICPYSSASVSVHNYYRSVTM